ncbi:protein timeless [Agrilus planipennis]|uniref:Protein timeless n=1 Tax=Agrilus planipennis TaxID=224129 RepID=A0A1W4XKM3_AGRPL|nr:protein timeless [Agrilus planipennis]
MAWMMNSSQVHNTFASLGAKHGDSYIISEDCISILNEILRNLVVEDRVLRTYRRTIGLCQNVKNDLMPLLIHAQTCKTETATKIVDATVKILVNLTIPVECLLSVETVSQSDVGRHTIFDLNRLLITSKEVFTDSRSTKAVVDHIKDTVEENELDIGKCDSINNCLLLLRNVLHIPESKLSLSNEITQTHMQNQIVWNLFAQSIGKIILNLLSCPEKAYWSTTLVQLLASLYKDQHAGNLKKLINLWFDASLSDSSEDNESNTSPPDQGSFFSSPNIMSDPTSDSSDTGVANTNNISNSNLKNINEWREKKSNSKSDSDNSSTNGKLVKDTEIVSNEEKNDAGCSATSSESSSRCRNFEDGGSSGKHFERDTSIDVSEISTDPKENSSSNDKESECDSDNRNNKQLYKSMKMDCVSGELSDYGYGTQPENPGESISTSSNDDDQPHEKPVHQKPPNFHKTRYNSTKNKTLSVLEKKENRKKKLVKRGKMNMINLKGLIRYSPTDDDITNILKEFTISFLLKGYAELVFDLHAQLLTNYHMQIDTSHFFWLVTFFLKFATELELEWEMLKPVLSFQIISYLVFQGVWIYEELEILYKNAESEIRPSLRRLHLTVTALKEFLQAVDTYSKATCLTERNRKELEKLKTQIVGMEELKRLFVLLLYQYDKNTQSKQYLQDLIETNHMYLLFYDNVCGKENHPTDIMDHLKNFSSSEIMHQYGILLENFQENGEFVNNCVFTMMHHVAGDLDNVSSLFQPHILKTFSSIWETDFDICDEWSDLIEYMINKFISTSKESENPDFTRVEHVTPIVVEDDIEDLSILAVSPTPSVNNDWTEEEKTKLQTYFDEECDGQDTVENILKKYEEVGSTNKTQKQIVKQLIKQKIINEDQVNSVLKKEDEEQNDDVQETEESTQESSQNQKNDIHILKEYLAKNNKGRFLLWLQEVLNEACFAKLLLSYPEEFKDCKHVPEPVEYYYASLNLPIPIVPWSVDQTNILKHQPFILLLHKLGFLLPTEIGKVFIRIPHFWTPDYILNIAQQLAPLNPAKLKFDINQVTSKPQYKDATTQQNYTVHNSNHNMHIVSSPIEIPKLDCLVSEKLDSPIPMDITTKEDSICDTASIASDLTRMYVSDEEEKVENIQQDD